MEVISGSGEGSTSTSKQCPVMAPGKDGEEEEDMFRRVVSKATGFPRCDPTNERWDIYTVGISVV